MGAHIAFLKELSGMYRRGTSPILALAPSAAATLQFANSAGVLRTLQAPLPVRRQCTQRRHMLMERPSKVAGLGPSRRRPANSCTCHGRQLIEEETAAPMFQGARWCGLQVIGHEVPKSVAWQSKQLRA